MGCSWKEKSDSAPTGWPHHPDMSFSTSITCHVLPLQLIFYAVTTPNKCCSFHLKGQNQHSPNRAGVKIAQVCLLPQAQMRPQAQPLEFPWKSYFLSTFSKFHKVSSKPPMNLKIEPKEKETCAWSSQTIQQTFFYPKVEKKNDQKFRKFWIKKQNFRTEKLFQRCSIQPRGEKKHSYSTISQSRPCRPMFWGRYDLMKFHQGSPYRSRFQQLITLQKNNSNALWLATNAPPHFFYLSKSFFSIPMSWEKKKKIYLFIYLFIYFFFTTTFAHA